MDDLRNDNIQLPDIAILLKTPMSALFRPNNITDDANEEGTANECDITLDFAHVLMKCVHKASTMILDDQEQYSRQIDRVQLLLKYLNREQNGKLTFVTNKK